MAASIKQLISHTAIYGITNMVGRFLNFLLVPLYTAILLPESFAVITVFYALAGFANVLLSFGMETTYFNYCRHDLEQKVFVNAMTWVVALALLFALIFGRSPALISNLVGFPEQEAIARWVVLILLADAFSVIPFARLRQQNKAIRFGFIKLSNISLNIGFNLFFLLLCPYLIKQGFDLSWYQKEEAVSYVFMSNLIASVCTFLLLLPGLRFKPSLLDKALLKPMLTYALPLVIVGFAGMINELIDRILLQRLLPEESADFDTGVYGAFYRLSIIITIFVQAFRFAAEPFFFEKSKEADAKVTYAKVMNYFVALCAFIFLCTLLFLENIAPVFIRQTEYFNHPYALLIVPILLMANIFLGIYYNLNIWYKLKNKNALGAAISVGGALLTLLMNFLLIPIIGILGSAITTMSVYFMMSLASYVIGQRHYPVPYNKGKLVLYLVSALVLFFISGLTDFFQNEYSSFFIRTLLAAVFLLMVFIMERPQKKW